MVSKAEYDANVTSGQLDLIPKAYVNVYSSRRTYSADCDNGFSVTYLKVWCIIVKRLKDRVGFDVRVSVQNTYTLHFDGVWNGRPPRSLDTEFRKLTALTMPQSAITTVGELLFTQGGIDH